MTKFPRSEGWFSSWRLLFLATYLVKSLDFSIFQVRKKYHPRSYEPWSSTSSDGMPTPVIRFRERFVSRRCYKVFGDSGDLSVPSRLDRKLYTHCNCAVRSCPSPPNHRPGWGQEGVNVPFAKRSSTLSPYTPNEKRSR